MDNVVALQQDESKELFFVGSMNDLTGLEKWLSTKRWNIVKEGLKDCKGQPMIGLMYRKHERFPPKKRGLVLSKTQEIYEASLEVVYEISDNFNR